MFRKDFHTLSVESKILKTAI